MVLRRASATALGECSRAVIMAVIVIAVGTMIVDVGDGDG